MTTPMSSDEWTTQLPKRFYDTATVRETGQGWLVLLDEREVRTPLKNMLVLPTEALSRAIAEEWSLQGERINPETMPVSKLAHTSIDHATAKSDAIVREFVSYAGTDMVCYRADAPPALVERQVAHWDPVLAWVEHSLGVQFVTTSGVIHCEQPESSISALEAHAAAFDAFKLTGVQSLTALTGSALLALNVAEGDIGAEGAWLAANVDEDWQVEQWGWDAEAQRQRASRHNEFAATVRFLSFLGN